MHVSVFVDLFSHWIGGGKMQYQCFSTIVAWSPKFFGNFHVPTHMNKNYFQLDSYFYYPTCTHTCTTPLTYHATHTTHTTRNTPAQACACTIPLNLIQMLHEMNFICLKIIHVLTVSAYISWKLDCFMWLLYILNSLMYVLMGKLSSHINKLYLP
jgi:hypothetical protein